jgi:FPC/CPF motif-containing protein YcgG
VTPVAYLIAQLTDLASAESRCMYKSYVGKLGWRFQFCDEPFFITSFAPCYPAQHSRYSYGEPSTWILFQPGNVHERFSVQYGV